MYSVKEYNVNMDTTIQIRTNNKIKLAAQKVFKKEGVSMSLAFNSFLQEVAHTKSFPVKVYPIKEVPASVARNWREQMEIDLKTAKRYNSAQELWEDSKNW